MESRMKVDRIQRVNWREMSFFLLFFTLLFLSYFYFFSPITVDIVLHAPPQRDESLQNDADCPYPNLMQLFYAHIKEGYNEKKSQHFRIENDKKIYKFSIGNYKTIDSLKFGQKIRFDPMMYHGTVFLEKIVVRQIGYKPFILDSANSFNFITVNNDIDSVEHVADGLILHSSGCDPQLQLIMLPQMIHIDYWFVLKIVCIVLIGGSILFILLSCYRDEQSFSYVPYFLVFILALIFSTAAISKNVIHPDEVVHVRAGEYYENHWMPPKICDPETKNTYSVFGVSRLDNFEISYFFAGKFSKLLSNFSIASFQRFRFFNVFLLFVLLLLSLKYIEFRFLSLPLIITPQVWYLFTCFNSDAFSLFIIILIGYQALAEGSMTNVYLRSPDNKEWTIKALLVGCSFSLLLLLKLNYYIFIVFLFLVFLQRLMTGKYINPKRVVYRVGVIVLISAAVFGVRWGIDIEQNGLNRNEKRMECREKIADHFFNPKTPLEKRYPFLRMKERKVPLIQLFEKHNWGFKTFVHSFGVYSFFPTPETGFFKFIMTVVLSFALYIIGSILLSGKLDYFVLLLNVLLSSIFITVLSLWNSWTASFQAQGRYLFPILIMTGYLLYERRSCLNRKMINGFVLLMFCLSVYSYVFWGMRQLLTA